MRSVGVGGSQMAPLKALVLFTLAALSASPARAGDDEDFICGKYKEIEIPSYRIVGSTNDGSPVPPTTLYAYVLTQEGVLGSAGWEPRYDSVAIPTASESAQGTFVTESKLIKLKARWKG